MRILKRLRCREPEEGVDRLGVAAQPLGELVRVEREAACDSEHVHVEDPSCSDTAGNAVIEGAAGRQQPRSHEHPLTGVDLDLRLSDAVVQSQRRVHMPDEGASSGMTYVGTLPSASPVSRSM